MPEPTDPTLRVYPSPEARTAADVFGEIAKGVPKAMRRCVGDRHYVGTEVARLATGVLYSCRDCPAEFVVEDDGTHVPVGEPG